MDDGSLIFPTRVEWASRKAVCALYQKEGNEAARSEVLRRFVVIRGDRDAHTWKKVAK